MRRTALVWRWQPKCLISLCTCTQRRLLEEILGERFNEVVQVIDPITCCLKLSSVLHNSPGNAANKLFALDVVSGGILRHRIPRHLHLLLGTRLSQLSRDRSPNLCRAIRRERHVYVCLLLH